MRTVTLAALILTAVSTAGAQRPRSAAELRGDSLLKAGNAGAAMAAYQQAIASDTANPRAWYSLGTAAYSAHDDPASAAAFERAATLGGNPTAMYNAGSVHARLHHTDLALAWLEKAVAAGFTNPAILASDSDLTSLHGNARFDAIVKKAQTAAAPCLDDPKYRAFDFWVGEWNVTPANASVSVGHSVIQRIAGGCGILENWTASNGSEGKSINTYNATVGQWQQYWVGQIGGLTAYQESHWDGPTLVFFARQTTAAGAPFLQRLSFTPLDSNTVRQFGEISSDSGKTWSVGYDFHYHRVK